MTKEEKAKALQELVRPEEEATRKWLEHVDKEMERNPLLELLNRKGKRRRQTP